MRNHIKDRANYKKKAQKVLNEEKKKRIGKKYRLVEVEKGCWKEVEVKD